MRNWSDTPREGVKNELRAPHVENGGTSETSQNPTKKIGKDVHQKRTAGAPEESGETLTVPSDEGRRKALMPCYHPLTAYRSRGRTKNGKQAITFNRKNGFKSSAFKLPCGQCIGCRLEKSRQWAVRCLHESKMHKENSFITLTYSKENASENQSPNVRTFQLFMKKLRFKYSTKKIRFFHCGEYGEKKIDQDTGEIWYHPHHHACLFGHDWEDKKLWKISNGVRIYVSDELKELWGLGHVTTGDVTFDSAAYVARYICKKITGKKAEAHYEGRIPEYLTMSRGGRGQGQGGIGTAWLEKYVNDVYPSDEVFVKGKRIKPPKFYDRHFAEMHPHEMEVIKNKRTPRGTTWEPDFGNDNPEQTPWRLKSKEIVKKSQLNQLKREMEKKHD